MSYTIHKGRHRPRWWFFLLWPWIGYEKKSITRLVRFDFNCKYDLHGEEDDLDVNKLFGLGYFWNKKESARFGWNYNNVTGKIDVFAYYHTAGTMDFARLCHVSVGLKYMMILEIHDSSYSFFVINTHNGLVEGQKVIEKPHKKRWSYNLGFFFGGTQKAPHDITVEIEKS